MSFIASPKKSSSLLLCAPLALCLLSACESDDAPNDSGTGGQTTSSTAGTGSTASAAAAGPKVDAAVTLDAASLTSCGAGETRPCPCASNPLEGGSQSCENGEFGACGPCDGSCMPGSSTVCMCASGGVGTAMCDGAAYGECNCGGDAGLPGGACPDGFMCTDSAGTGQTTCGMPGFGGIVMPPACTTVDDCTKLGLTSAACTSVSVLGTLCLQVCTP